jgi:hypothetical protein
VFFTALLVCVSQGQTTQPVRLAWPDVVTSIADAVVDERGEENLAHLLPGDVLVRRFDRADCDDLPTLHTALQGTLVVATHGYLGVPNSLASDLAVDFRNSPIVPEEIRSELIPEDEAQAKRANITAAQWVHNTIQPASMQPIGVIALLRRDPIDPANSSLDSYTLKFILLKAEPMPGGQFRITHVVYGDTRHIIR